MKKINITIIPHNDHDYDSCLLSAWNLKKRTLLGYADVKIEEVDDKGKREEE